MIHRLTPLCVQLFCHGVTHLPRIGQSPLHSWYCWIEFLHSKNMGNPKLIIISPKKTVPRQYWEDVALKTKLWQPGLAWWFIINPDLAKFSEMLILAKSMNKAGIYFMWSGHLQTSFMSKDMKYWGFLWVLSDLWITEFQDKTQGEPVYRKFKSFQLLCHNSMQTVEYHYPCPRHAYHTFPQEKYQWHIPSVAVKFVLMGIQSKCMSFVSGLKISNTASS